MHPIHPQLKENNNKTNYRVIEFLKKEITFEGLEYYKE